jgi:hypothetical protein
MNIWLQEIGEIQPRKLVVPNASEQEASISSILSELESEPCEPSAQLVCKTEQAISELLKRIPDADQFVARSFHTYLPAWKKLLTNSRRASSKKVLRWIEHGFVPKFCGAANTESKKKEAVQGMLRRIMPENQIEAYLSTKQPGVAEFKNHRSFYKHWDFSSVEVANLFRVGTATLLPLGAPKPILVHPFGVASTAGKLRLNCDARCLNIFLELFPFRYEKLRDVLAYT